MKTKILKLSVTAAMVVISFTAFSQEDQKSKEARKDVAEAKKDLKEAKADSAADFQEFKKDAEIKIADNKKKIAVLKTKKASSNKDDDKKYNEKVAALEKKNNELENKINGCSHTKTSKWTSFKHEFNHDMNELGHAFKDIGVDNTK